MALSSHSFLSARRHKVQYYEDFYGIENLEEDAEGTPEHCESESDSDDDDDDEVSRQLRQVMAETRASRKNRKARAKRSNAAVNPETPGNTTEDEAPAESSSKKLTPIKFGMFSKMSPLAQAARAKEGSTTQPSSEENQAGRNEFLESLAESEPPSSEDELAQMSEPNADAMTPEEGLFVPQVSHKHSATRPKSSRNIRQHDGTLSRPSSNTRGQVKQRLDREQIAKLDSKPLTRSAARQKKAIMDATRPGMKSQRRGRGDGVTVVVDLTGVDIDEYESVD